MNSLFFWNKWNSPFRQMYLLLLGVFFCSVVLFSVSFFVDITGVVKWDRQTELEPVKTTIGSFSKDLFNFSVQADSYIAADKFIATEIQPSILYSNIYLISIVIGILFILTTITFLEVYWYMGGMFAFLSFLISLKLDMLELFGRTDRLPLIGFILFFGGVSYYFNSINKSVSYLHRLLVFTSQTIVAAFVIWKFSKVENPFLYLSNFGSTFPVIISILFIIVIGHDVIKGFVYLVSSGTSTIKNKNRILNFIFISLLYLIILFLLLLKKMYILELDIVYINAFLIYIVSAVLGIWMFKKRSEMFSSVLPFIPAGAFVYMGLAIISTSGMAYAFINGNSGMIDAYERIIIYGHLFLGFLFFIYVLINFGKLFDERISVYDILYKPARMTFLVVPAVGLTIAVIFFLFSNRYPYYLTISGYYTYAGDVFLYEKEYPLAFKYYEQAVINDHPNVRANYSIASLAHYLNDKATAQDYYQNALSRQANVHSYIGLSNIYMENGELFQAMFKLQEGIKDFPKNGELYNNLGLIYSKINIMDSAFYYLDKSQKLLSENQTPVSNMIYVYAKKNLWEEADSLASLNNFENHISFQNNKLAVYNQFQKVDSMKLNNSLLTDSILNANTFAYLANYNINKLKTPDTLAFNKAKEANKYEGNLHYSSKLSYLTVFKNYYSNEKLKAVVELELMRNNSTSNYEYANTLGYWMLEQENYIASAENFREASKNGDKNTQINYCIAAMEAGQFSDALFVLNQLKYNEDPDIKKISENLIKICSTDKPEEVLKWEEALKVQYLHFARTKLNASSRITIINSITNESFKGLAVADLMDYYIDNRNALALENDLAAIKLSLSTKYVKPLQEYNYQNLRYMSLKKDWRSIKNILTTASDQEFNQSFNRSYFTALYSEGLGDSATAETNYKRAVKECPFNEDALIAAASFLNKRNQQQYAYDFLVEVVQQNPESLKLLKAYFDQCIEMGLVSYAESTLEQLKSKITTMEYKEMKLMLTQAELQ